MLRRRLGRLTLAALTTSALLCALIVRTARPQEKAKGQTETPATKEKPKSAPPAPIQDAAKRHKLITKMLDEYDLRPHPAPTIPDDPPPHEGAMISIPHVLEPPDLVIVEVLEALPGRPISGERLVRPDGKISIGFYGDVSVRGMTLDQVKVAIIKHLRKFLSDDILGLQFPETDPAIDRPVPPPLPGQQENPFDLEPQRKDEPKPRPTSSQTSPHSHHREVRSAARGRSSARAVADSGRSRIVRISAQEGAVAPSSPGAVVVPVGPQGKVIVKIEIQGENPVEGVGAQPAPVPGNIPEAINLDEGPWTIVPPAESYSVFVDVTAYNSKNYYVLGDILIPGKLPCTGSETVLDALQFAGGLMASADPKNVSLIRPGRNGKPAKVYRVDLAAIQDRGDVSTNYQLFPNDRLVVGRDEVVKKTAALDRLAEPIRTATSSIHSVANMLRAVQLAGESNSGALLRAMVEFWTKEAARQGDIKFDESTLREILLQERKTVPTPKK